MATSACAGAWRPIWRGSGIACVYGWTISGLCSGWRRARRKVIGRASACMTGLWVMPWPPTCLCPWRTFGLKPLAAIFHWSGCKARCKRPTPWRGAGLDQSGVPQRRALCAAQPRTALAGIAGAGRGVDQVFFLSRFQPSQRRFVARRLCTNRGDLLVRTGTGRVCTCCIRGTHRAAICLCQRAHCGLA